MQYISNVILWDLPSLTSKAAIISDSLPSPFSSISLEVCQERAEICFLLEFIRVVHTCIMVYFPFLSDI